MDTDTMRIGHGYDVHRFDANVQDGASIMLCGCQIPSDQKLLAHSDGDVALHAVCDALLGAIAAGDIGQHFPDTDESYKDADSGLLLKRVVEMVKQEAYVVGNLDITIIAQKPRLAPHVKKMREVVSDLLDADIGAVNVKATTTEGLGFTGREEGISVHAVVILYKKG